VDAAAFALLKEGRNPTVSLVRERMGGASPNVVAPALQRWRLTFAAQLQDNSSSALEVLPPGVLELVQALWSRALFEGHRVQADAPTIVEGIERLNAAIADLREQAGRLQAREAEVDAQLRALDRQRRGLAEAESALARRRAAKRSGTLPARGRGSASKAAVSSAPVRRKKTRKSSPKPQPMRAQRRSGTTHKRR
jgi:hypothetical protein